MKTETEDAYKGKLAPGAVYPPNEWHDISEAHITTLPHNEAVTGDDLTKLSAECSKELKSAVEAIPADRWPETHLNTLQHWIQMNQTMMQMKTCTSLKDIEHLDAVWKEYSARLAVVTKNARKSTTNLQSAIASRKSSREKASDDAAKAAKKAEDEHIKSLDKVRLDRMKNVLLPSGIFLTHSSRDSTSTRYYKHLAKQARKLHGSRWPSRPGTQSRLMPTIRRSRMWT